MARWKRQLGQSMVEYTIVLVFGVLALTTGPSGNVMLDLLQVIKDNYQGYSFGISLSEAPDFDTAGDYKGELKKQKVDKDTIGRLAVKSDELYAELEPYNKDPYTQMRTLGKTKEAKTRWFESVDGLKNKTVEVGDAIASFFGF